MVTRKFTKSKSRTFNVAHAIMKNTVLHYNDLNVRAQRKRLWYNKPFVSSLPSHSNLSNLKLKYITENKLLYTYKKK